MECRPSQIKDKADVKANPLHSFLTINNKNYENERRRSNTEREVHKVERISQGWR